MEDFYVSLYTYMRPSMLEDHWLMVYLFKDSSKLRLELSDFSQAFHKEAGHGEEAKGVTSWGSVKHHHRKLQLFHQTTQAHAHGKERAWNYAASVSSLHTYIYNYTGSIGVKVWYVVNH